TRKTPTPSRKRAPAPDPPAPPPSVQMDWLETPVHPHDRPCPTPASLPLTPPPGHRMDLRVTAGRTERRGAVVVHVERDEVERPLVAQLEAMGWTHVPGVELDTLDAAVPLLVDQLGPALRRINLRGSDGQPWMGEDDIRRAV